MFHKLEWVIFIPNSHTFPMMDLLSSICVYVAIMYSFVVPKVFCFVFFTIFLGWHETIIRKPMNHADS